MVELLCMNCPKCGTKMVVSVCIVGGNCCQQEYCYYSSPKIQAVFQCPKTRTYEYIGPRLVRLKNVCGQKNVGIYELSDVEAMSRYLTENYKPSQKDLSNHKL